MRSWKATRTSPRSRAINANPAAKAASAAGAANGDSRRLNAQLLGVGEEPLQSGVAILDRRGKRMFRRQSIIDRYRYASDALDQLLHEAVILLDVAHHVSAAVNPQQRREFARLIDGPINADPHRRIAFGTEHQLILAVHALDRWQACEHRGHHFFHLDPRNGNFVEIHRAIGRQLFHYRSQLRVELIDEAHMSSSRKMTFGNVRKLSHDSKSI